MTEPRQPRRRLGLGGGAWVLGAAVVLVLLVSAWRILPVIRTQSRAVGDGHDIDSYGFDLTSLDISTGPLVASGFPRDGVPTLDDPATMPGSAIGGFNETVWGKYLVPTDRVIGVVVEGEARAYPVRVMNWHEIVNDTLGGVPIAVTFHPLCDSTVVFDRSTASGGSLRFGVSGLLWNSNLLMYDRRDDDENASLWSQILARAVSGPARGRRLRVLPSSLTQWEDWLERHPRTTVLHPDSQLLRRYRRNPYGNYLGTGKLRFPVSPQPRGTDPGLMEPMLVLETGGRRLVVSPREGPLPIPPVAWPGRVEIDATPGSTTVSVEGEFDAVFHVAWFAWLAHHPDAEGNVGFWTSLEQER